MRWYWSYVISEAWIERSADIGDPLPAALTEYLAGVEEPALKQAYELGRQALGEGLGILDVAAVHGEALERALRQTRLPEKAQQAGETGDGVFSWRACRPLK